MIKRLSGFDSRCWWPAHPLRFPAPARDLLDRLDAISAELRFLAPLAVHPLPQAALDAVAAGNLPLRSVDE